MNHSSKPFIRYETNEKTEIRHIQTSKGDIYVSRLNNMEDQKHWANSLEIGHKVIAFVRHESDGRKNFRARFTVIENDRINKKIVAALGDKTYTIPYNELMNNIILAVD